MSTTKNATTADAASNHPLTSSKVVTSFLGVGQLALLTLVVVASLRSLPAMAVYGLIFIGLAIVASIPFGLGWLVLGPVMAGSWYASWRETFDA